MEIHQYEKLWFGASLVLIVAFIATIAYGSVGAGVEMVDDEGGQIDPNNISDHEKFQDWPQQRAQHVEGDQYEVSVQALRFGFFPGNTQEGSESPIRVPENSEVTFYVTSPDVIHGFSIVGTNVNTMVIPGEISEVTVEFDDPGEYGIICHEYCGAGHEDMEGKIVVVPEDDWEGDA